jgi:hypothetical protein
VTQNVQPPAIAAAPACDANALSTLPRDSTRLNVPAEETDSGPLRSLESHRRTRGRKLATHALALDDAPPGEVSRRGGGDERQLRDEKQRDETKSSQGFEGSACSSGLPTGPASGFP